jgi:hypothetical protein
LKREREELDGGGSAAKFWQKMHALATRMDTTTLRKGVVVTEMLLGGHLVARRKGWQGGAHVDFIGGVASGWCEGEGKNGGVAR